MPNSVHIAELALRLHKTDGADLRLELDAATVVTDDKPPLGYALIGNVLEFENLAERNRHVAESIYQGIQKNLDRAPDLLYESAYELWRYEIGHADKASGRLMGLASPHLDILAIGSQRIRHGEGVFDVLHLVEAALPFTEELNVGSLIDLCVAKHDQTQNDLAGGVIHGALETWLSSRPRHAIELHNRVSEQLIDATATLLSNAVVALAKSDYAAALELSKVDANHPLLLRAQVGIWTLGRLLLEEHASDVQRAIIATLLTNFIESSEGDLRLQAVRAVTSVMHINSTFDALLKRLAMEGDQDVLSGVAAALFLKANEMLSRGDMHEWMKLMTALAPDRKGAIDNLDNAMARLLAQPANSPIVVETLTKWVARHGRRMAIDKSVVDLFGDSVRKLSGIEPAWSTLLTEWLLSDKQEHAACLAGMLAALSHHKALSARLHKEQLDALTPPDLLFLARRMMGYVHDRGQVTSMALSMLDSRDAKDRIFPVLYALLVSEIGYDYPGSTIKSCEVAAESCASEEIKAFLAGVVEALEQIGKAFGNLPRLKEFRPSLRLRRQFARARAKQMSDSMEEASKNSLWRQISTQIPIKAGGGTFNYQNSSYGPSMRMSSISHSIEMPRREVFDPVGNSIRSLEFRLAKRGNS